MPRAMDALLEEKREEKRHETARRLIRIRVGAASAWFLYTAYFGLYAGRADFRASLPFTGIYAAASLALYLGSLKYPSLVRRSWMSLPLLDVPLIFIIQYLGTSLSETPIGNAAFSVGILAILIIVAQLSMRIRNVLVTAAVAIVIEILLLMRAGVSLYGWLAAVIVLSTCAFSASAVVDEFSILLGAVVAERTRISRELHDTLAQGLAGISVQLESVEAMLEASPHVARQHLDRARALARSSLAEARRSVWSLREPAASSADLAESLADLVRHVALDTPARVQLNVVGDRRRLPPEIEANLLRIGQEGLINAAKHGCARLIEVELRFEQRRVLLAIRDDGVGLHPGASTVDAIARFGIIGMHERAKRIDGSLDIRNRESGGTEIVLAVRHF